MNLNDAADVRDATYRRDFNSRQKEQAVRVGAMRSIRHGRPQAGLADRRSLPASVTLWPDLLGADEARGRADPAQAFVVIDAHHLAAAHSQQR